MGWWFLLFLVYSVVAGTKGSVRGEISHTTCSIESQDEVQQQQNESSIHLSLHHVHGPCSPLPRPSALKFSDVISHDKARVEALNSRIIVSTAATDVPLRPKSVSIPLKPGSSYGSGNYYIQIGLGTPAKYYAMILDTGSSFTWLQCQPCRVYCHPQQGPIFNPTESKTHHFLSCDTSECSALESATLNPSGCTTSNVCLYEASYGDNSFSVGYLSRDSLTLMASALPAFVYGCGQDNEGLFGRIAGIVGFARNKLSMLGQLSSKYGYAFSYCLPTTSSSRGGYLSIGTPSLLNRPYQFTPLITTSLDPTLYFIRLTSITLAGKPLTGVSPVQYTSFSIIIDSGTVITRLPMTIYTPLQEAFVKFMTSKRYARAPSVSILDACFKGQPDLMSVPQVGLVFQGGATLNLGAGNVVIEADKGIMCLAFAGSSSSYTTELGIIGNHQQQTFSVAYDVSHSRIGFAAAGCR